MRLLSNNRFNLLLVGAAPLSLLLAWLTGYWTLGAAGAAAALCLFALRQPQLSWRIARRNVVPTMECASPQEPEIDADAHTFDGTLLEQMVATGRVALLLRPQIASGLDADDLEAAQTALDQRSEEHTSELQSPCNLVC